MGPLHVRTKPIDRLCRTREYAAVPQTASTLPSYSSSICSSRQVLNAIFGDIVFILGIIDGYKVDVCPTPPYPALPRPPRSPRPTPP